MKFLSPTSFKKIFESKFDKLFDTDMPLQLEELLDLFRDNGLGEVNFYKLNKQHWEAKYKNFTILYYGDIFNILDDKYNGIGSSDEPAEILSVIKEYI